LGEIGYQPIAHKTSTLISRTTHSQSRTLGSRGRSGVRGIKDMGLSLLDDGCEGLVQLSHTQLGLTGIPSLEGLLEGSAQGLLQGLGVGPAVDPSVVGLVGVLDLR